VKAPDVLVVGGGAISATVARRKHQPMHTIAAPTADSIALDLSNEERARRNEGV
jgi:L-2-hydroxyglutarate oxidase LhgO